MNIFVGIYLLSWKNLKLKLRHPIVLLMEIGMPCLFSAILAIVRVVVTFDSVTEPTFYPTMPLDISYILDSKIILYAPENVFTNSVMTYIKNNSNVDTLQVISFDDEKHMVDHFENESDDIIVCGLFFRDLDPNQKRFDVKLRFPFAPKQQQQQQDSGVKQIEQFTWQTGRLFPMFQVPGPRGPKLAEGGPPGYYNEGFLYIQHQISRAIAIQLNESLKDEFQNIEVNVQRFPYPPYEDDKFLFALQFFFPLILMLSFIYPSVNLTKNIVLEKEQRLTEAMRMMGLNDSLHWTSWFVNSLLWNMISLGIITTLLCAYLKPNIAILSHSDPLLILLFFIMYNISSIMFCFFLSTFFSRANIAGVITGALYFATFLPYFQMNMNYRDLSLLAKLSISTIFNTNMALGCMITSVWESKNVGLQWWNLFEASSPDDDLNFFHILLMFAVDSVIYFLAALYIQNVFPGEFGFPKKWYYFLDPEYWCGISSSSSKSKIDDQAIKLSQIEKAQNSKPNNLSKSGSIHIENLSKSYDRGKTFAVKSLNLQMAQNEITVLLGHNGAGKTTLMSMLCGLLPPSSGRVQVGGRDLMKEIDKIRKDLGICPQFDVLFNHLTVEEHLWWWSKLKGIDSSVISFEIDRMISLLDLESKRKKRANTLSGGMKRKLSVGIALVGGSKFVLLDEATSGMDVSARRFIWDLLIKEKKNRVILLSTHFMEEADVLGDKIAIIEQGSMKCFDSPMKLKKQYGLGYLLTFAINEEKVKIQLLNDLIRSNINQAKLLTSVGTEITYSLPEYETKKFEKLFQTIEQNMDRLGVVNFGISVTTIEEVFLSVGDFAKQGTEQFNNFNNNSNEKKGGFLEKVRPNSLKTNKNFAHLFQIYWSMLVKKMIFFWRNPFLIFAQLFLPALLLTVSILTDRGQMDKAFSSPQLLLSIDSYKKMYVSSYRDQSEAANRLSHIYAKLVQASAGLTEVKLSEYQYDHEKLENQSLTDLANYGRKYVAEYNLYDMLSVRFKADVNDSSKIQLTALFNNQAYHTSATSLALLDNALMRYLLRDESFEINVWNEPLPRRQRDTISVRQFDSTVQVQLTNSLLFSICFLLASFIILLVKERSSHFRHIQQISGLRLFQYWTSNFILDYATFIVSSFMLVSVIYFLRVDAFQVWTQIGYLAITFVFTGLSALPFIYLCSIIFTDPATAYVRISLYMLIAGTTCFLMVLILEIPEFKLLYLSKTLDIVFSLILPVYTMSISVYSIFSNYKAQEFCLGEWNWFNSTINVQDFCKDNMWEMFPPIKACCQEICETNCFYFNENYFGWLKPGLAQYLLSFLFQAAVFWLLLIVLEYDKINWRSILDTCFSSDTKQSGEEIQGDDDVRNEENRIRRRSSFTLAKTDSMIVQNLTKKYGNFTAVNNISFGVRKAECFGILGVNGAGKTTTFKMITGAEKITSGNIIVNGINVKDDIGSIYKHIGYCPQFDGLLDQLTGRETLRIVLRIRGVHESFIDQQIDAFSKLLFFSKHIDKPVSSYSGGTKRKLSFAIATVGNPLIVFLDEPTTGVDPVSRRCLWNAIQLIRTAGSSIAFTSHSMEECEALCNRLFIMVNAKISCIGSALHLKQKYGAGYVVQVKLKSNGDDESNSADEFSRQLANRWPACRLESCHNNLFTYRVESGDVRLSTLFGDIERMKAVYCIEDYSICQTSLESIFLSFARKQRSEE